MWLKTKLVSVNYDSISKIIYIKRKKLMLGWIWTNNCCFDFEHSKLKIFEKWFFSLVRGKIIKKNFSTVFQKVPRQLKKQFWNKIEMAIDSSANSLDVVFSEIGEFTYLQVARYILLCIPNAIAGMYVLTYVFTAISLDYR